MSKARIKKVYEEWQSGRSEGCRLEPTKIGETPKYIEKYLKDKGLSIENTDIVIAAKQLSHMFRDMKVEIGKAIEFSDLIDFIENMKSYSAAYDPRHKNFVMYKSKDEGAIVKFAIALNKKVKGYGKSNVVVTAGKIMRYDSLWSNGVELIKRHP